MRQKPEREHYGPVRLAGELDPETMVRPLVRETDQQTAERLKLNLLIFQTLSSDDQRDLIDKAFSRRG